MSKTNVISFNIEKQIPGKSIRLYIYEPEITGTQLSFCVDLKKIKGLIHNNHLLMSQGEKQVNESLSEIDRFEHWKPVNQEILNNLARGTIISCLGKGGSNWDISALESIDEYCHIVFIIYKKSIDDNGFTRKILAKSKNEIISDNDIENIAKDLVKDDKKKYPDVFKKAEVIPLFR